MNRLIGKVALITGGNRGIGKGIAKIFLSEGANVVICGRNIDLLNKAVSSLKDNTGKIMAIQCDVSKNQQVKSMVMKIIRKYEKLDILVNNAGFGGHGKSILELKEEEWNITFDSNTKGTWLCSKYSIPEMIKNGGGSIIIISSISAYRGQRLNDCYNASKAAQEMLMKCMALDFAKDNIRVNSICPAWVATEENKLEEKNKESILNLPTGIERISDIINLHPIGRFGSPEDIAWAAVYLASDESLWVTGASFMVDGGYTCK